jgi:uncharacterized protein DUF6587
MNHLLDNLLVGAVLLVSLGYAFARLGPRTLRQRMLAVLARLLAAAPAIFRLQRVAQRLSAASAKAQAACGGCDSCGSETAPPKASAEISIPVGKIGRRA